MVINSLEAMVAHAGRSFLPVGALVHDQGVTFRVWAPKHRQLRVVTGDGSSTRYVTLAAEDGPEPGFFSGRDEHGKAGDLYWVELDHRLVPDPASRCQPRGVEGPSQVVDPSAYAWREHAWQRPAWRGRVIYELHVGTFSPEGTFAGAINRLDALVDLGVNTIELMPLAEFAGDRNWGYDGVMLFAPPRCYGTPDELRALIDAAHARGLAVMVDVVYNHLGPCGNVLPAYADDYFHSQQSNPWGAGLNFDGAHSGPVREFFLQNVCLWLDEYRVDGLRLDAVHAMTDRSPRHLVAEIAATAHARGAFVVAEDDRNDAQLLAAAPDGGWDLDGVWSDDFHHTVRVAATGHREAHLGNYSGALDEWVATLREGWFFRGQMFPSWQRPRGTRAQHVPPEKFVLCISNHDQVGNRPLGERLSAVVSAEVYRALSMLLCLAPYTPLLFMGQEWGATSPFPFFTDHPGEVGANMARYRQNEFRHYGASYPDEVLRRMPAPQDPATFHAAKLDWKERDAPPHAAVLALYRECLAFRARLAIFQSAPRECWTAEKVGANGLALEWHEPAGTRWRLLISLVAGTELEPEDHDGWRLALASNAPRFGGREGSERVGPGAILWERRAT
jgi:maltooligosyltrehalose trehalohydrolase